MKCPICEKKFSPSDDPLALPFCSLRCKMIDAKRWLDEEYVVVAINPQKLEEEIAAWEAASPPAAEEN
ncbi:MAG: DNA gyrase inhibitor YacG [Planctomycetia bacterium]|nr:DNA gyrase inhibitor YacG [Planctomycetia bacterium]